MPYRSYEEIARLDIGTQRQLLQHADEVERVWAAWALAVALGADSAPDLLTSLRESPAAGTRRHLLVVLAGLGEHDVLYTFAQDDPDAYVRATACQYLVRTSRSADSATQQFVRQRVLDDPSPIVRQIILDELPIESPMLDLDDLTQLANDADLDVRQKAVERLIATASLDWLFPGVLEERILVEDDAALRHRLLALCIQAGGATRLLVLHNTLVPEHMHETLELLVGANLQFSWEYLRPLSTTNDPHQDALLVQLLKPTSTIAAASWLLACVARAATWPKSRNRPEAELSDAVLTASRQATQLLVAAIPQFLSIERTAIDQHIVRAVVSYLQKGIDELEWGREHDEWDVNSSWYERTIREQQSLVAALQQLLGFR